MGISNYIASFGDGSTIYNFPTTQTQLRDNFSDMVPRTVRVPGTDGGFDQFGEGKAPSEIGNVSVTFEQYSEDDNLQTLRDAVREMAAWGVQLLTRVTSDESERYCYARVNSITMTEAPNDPIGGRKLTATVDFQVAEPYWFTVGTWGATDGTWTSAITLTGIGTVALDDATSTQMATSVGGLFPTYPKFYIVTTGGNMTTVAIKRTDAAYEPEEAASDADLYITGLATTSLVIDCEAMAVAYGADTILAGTEAFDKVTTYLYPNFVKLQPGTGNYFKVWVVGGSGRTVKIGWKERY
jgi:hypothetical protein